MKRILLATDLGPNSDRAMERALKIAHEQNAMLYVIHIAPYYLGPQNKKWVHDFQKETKEIIEGYLYDYLDFIDVETEIIVKEGGEIFSQILEAAYANKVDLIVMGTHSKENFRDLFTGTTLERVVRKGTLPVLMVKEKPTGPYQAILSAIDYSPGSRASLRLAMELSPKAVFYALHAYTVPVYSIPRAYEINGIAYESTKKISEMNQKKIMGAFLETERTHFTKQHNGSDKRLSSLIIEGSVYETISKKAKHLQADLITIGAHGQFGLISKLGGTAAEILANPPCDILLTTEKTQA